MNEKLLKLIKKKYLTYLNCFHLVNSAHIYITGAAVLVLISDVQE